MPSLETGIHFIDAATYHADPCREPSLSSTIARILINQSPLHAWTACPRLNPNHAPVEKKTFDIGRAAHTLVLGKGEPPVAYPDDILGANGAASTKAAKEFAERARASGMVPLKAGEVADIEAMVGRVHDRLDQIKTWLDSDRSEVTAIAEIDGAWCRAMIDNAPEDPREPLWDFKTTTDAREDQLQRAILNYGYDVQAAHYLEVWKAATGEDRQFRFIFQEKVAPYEVQIVQLGYDTLAMARKKLARAREIWLNCLRANHWPGYPPGIIQMDLPAWAQERWLEKESAEADYRQRTGHDILDHARRWQAPIHLAGE